MRIAGAIGIFVANAIWRLTGLPAAGRVLLSALGSGDETVRTLAGMFLVKAGKRSVPILEEAIERRENLPIVLTILGDIGDRRFITELRQFSEDRDPEVARAARHALRILNAH
jgi:HEAT repeat protein